MEEIRSPILVFVGNSIDDRILYMITRSPGRSTGSRAEERAMDIRRVQMTGGSSFVVTLPKEWATKLKIRKNDPLRVITQADGTLLITPNIGEDPVQRTREFDVTSCTSAPFLFRSLIGTYIAGYTEITVRSKTRLPPFVRMVVRDFTQMTIGQEVMEETDTMIRIKDLLSPSELSFESTLKRMFVVVRAMHRDACAALASGDPELAREVIDEDRDVDRLHWLIARHANMLLRHSVLSRKMGVTLVTASTYTVVSRILERIGDHAVRIARNALLLGDHPLDRGTLDRVTGASEEALGILERAVASLFTRDIRLAERSIEEVHQAQVLYEELHGIALTQTAKTAIPLGAIVESVRRLAEYSGDIAECVINHLVDQEA